MRQDILVVRGKKKHFAKIELLQVSINIVQYDAGTVMEISNFLQSI